jgi:superfamily II DNA or RNA helicase
VVGSIPSNIRKALNLPNDSKGIDGVYEDQAGNYIPYQVKYRTDMDTLPYGEISPFLGITEKSLQDRMIFTNARKLSVDVANRTGVRSFRADKFHELTEADFKGIHAWLTDKKVEPFKRWDPLPHQREAIEKITAGLKEADRTTAVMACGTGKTLVALWAAEAQDPKTVLVLVPSLALLSQTLPDWCKQTSWGKRFRYLCVCSDASVDRPAKDADEYALNQTDLEFTVTTDAKEVKKFLGLNKDGVNVIFSTYQSAEVVAEGLKGQTADLGIFDEAHKTTGDKEGLFAFGLSDKNIRIKKRLFLTATPRHYKLNKRDKDGDFQVVSMDDETVYGKVSYRLPFSAAVAAGIIVPYKVIISVSLNKEVDAELLRRGSTRVRRDEIQAKWVANQIALKRAIEKTGASKIITFHSRVNLAEEFAGDSARGFQEHVKGFDVFHVNGGQNAADRKALLEDFKASPRGLITNARCLTEGVDVPAVDMVAFVDPRKSKIDIAQAAGRAMRQSKATNKKLGYIVVPLFIEQKKGETEAEAFTRSGFDEVAEVLGAMLESDDDLVDTIKELQQARGRGDKFNPRQLHDKIEVIGPAINLDKLTQSIDVEILDRLGVSWDRFYGLLQKFHNKNGHSRVPVSFEVSRIKLGSWVSRQRQIAQALTPDQLKRLDSLGFSWDPHTEIWDKAYSHLHDFFKINGHSRVARNVTKDGYNMGKWVSVQRHNKAKLTPDQIRRLNEVKFSWDPFSEQWEEGFAALKKFRSREGHCLTKDKLRIDGFNLGVWVGTQRQNKDQLTSEQLSRLDSLGFCWDPIADQWEERFAALKEFHAREGHAKVLQTHIEGNLKLGIWVADQRQRRKTLTAEQTSRLNSLGFSWDPITEQWEKGFAALKAFHAREGHSKVSQKQQEEGVKLGLWVGSQRMRRNQLTAEQIRRLDSLNFCWDPLTEQWEEGFAALKEFHAREGHAKVLQTHKEGNLKLGVWVAGQRQRRRNLTADQTSRLNSLGFSWDPITEQWEQGFTALKAFHAREGHCRVTRDVKTNSLKLGTWVDIQRQTKAKLSPDQIARLDSIGFSWDPHREIWEKSFKALKSFHEKEGHCRAPVGLIFHGINLNNWIGTQRTKKNHLTSEQLGRLDLLGFSWDPISEQWEEGFEALKQFHRIEGHCLVPQNYTLGKFKLGGWVSRQRQNKTKLTDSRIKRLEVLGFKWK